ncbi:hypothetical protein GGD81_003109 [Rhodobium orientis]|uniref:hypothetical protein n=1 Tax=Rhodobium orientis TaxID=34017 RepID=UPI00181F9345|nr:hypothetical protein [Rhodobium orientis]MBB4304054.1 hypothetical protein [Rhodobium orientis]
MRTRFLVTFAVLCTALFALSDVASAAAETLTWQVRSEHPNTVAVEFYSQDRNAAWPGDGEVYLIRDWDTHTFKLDCRRGESICYGAWVRNQSSSYWGVGKDNARGCQRCCYVCGGGRTKTQVLNP